MTRKLAFLVLALAPSVQAQEKAGAKSAPAPLPAPKMSAEGKEVRRGLARRRHGLDVHLDEQEVAADRGSQEGIKPFSRQMPRPAVPDEHETVLTAQECSKPQDQ
jgi:hypothetical protein